MPANYRAHVAPRGLADAGAAFIDSNTFEIQAGDTLYIAVGNSDGSPLDTNSCVWDPAGANQSMGAPIHTAATINGFGKFNIYRAQGLTPGAAKVVRAGWSGNQGERIIAGWIGTSVDTGTPNAAIDAASGNNTSFSVTADPTSVGQRVLCFAYVLDINGPIPDPAFNSANGTERAEGYTATPAYDCMAIQDMAAAGVTQALTWTLAGWVDPHWYGVAIALNEAGSGVSLQAVERGRSLGRGLLRGV